MATFLKAGHMRFVTIFKSQPLEAREHLESLIVFSELDGPDLRYDIGARSTLLHSMCNQQWRIYQALMTPTILVLAL